MAEETNCAKRNAIAMARERAGIMNMMVSAIAVTGIVADVSVDEA